MIRIVRVLRRRHNDRVLMVVHEDSTLGNIGEYVDGRHGINEYHGDGEETTESATISTSTCPVCDLRATTQLRLGETGT